jgi:hypothetical protein
VKPALTCYARNAECFALKVSARKSLVDVLGVVTVMLEKDCSPLYKSEYL